MAIVGINLFDIDLPYAWVMFVCMIFSNPVFVYFLSFLFEKDNTGSIITRLLYVLFGGICPLAVSILSVIPSTVEWGKTLRWFFYIVPIFSLDYGI